MQSTISKSVLD